MTDAVEDARVAEAAPVETAPSPASPGALVRQARERAGLGLEDLAGQLKLAKATLESLERDDFAVLEPVYVRGYFRKIAKVLPVNEAELLSAYGARVRPGAEPAPQRIPLASGVASGTSRHYQGQGLGLLVLVVVGLGAGYVLMNDTPPPSAGVEAPQAAEPAPVATPAAGAPAEVAPEADVPAAEPAPVPDAPAPAGGQLVLEFQESSFVRIEDARNRTLAIGLMRSGERQVLDGQPPYTVFLGNAQNVRVLFGGSPVDFSAHINAQNDTARFTVP